MTVNVNTVDSLMATTSRKRPPPISKYCFKCSLSYFVDPSRKSPPPVIIHFVVPQGWLLTREFTVVSSLLA